MQIRTTDYNDAGGVIQSTFADEWHELEVILASMKLHLKRSDQAKIRGSLIFDPVGTNEYVKSSLQQLPNWTPNYPIPRNFDFLGTDVDFVANGLLVEIQFSNYPFLLNNTVRSELFFKARTPLAGQRIQAAIIVTKAKMFPASNSTLYYEQAVKQLRELARHGVFSVPTRVVGLFEAINTTVDAVFTEYTDSRYSRTVEDRRAERYHISPGRRARSRCRISADR